MNHNLMLISEVLKKLPILFLVLLCMACQGTKNAEWQKMSEPVENGRWIQPSQEFPARPIWGHKDGIRVGLSPMQGPRGLIRIYTPYLGHKEGKMMNFFALEPILKGSELRSLSELEMSDLDKKRGKRFWSAEDSLATDPQLQTEPVQGKIRKEGDIETLALYVFSEPFHSGAEVYVRLKFYSDRPYEVEISTYSTEESAELDYFIVTATMGNYARLRTLYLDEKKVVSTDLWPEYKEAAFTEHRHFPVSDFIKDGTGNAYVVSATDEDQPAEVTYAEKTNPHWIYYGDKGTQYWYASESIPGLECLVNGRYTYWGGESPIPGGISFENFELKAPFEEGRTFVFGVDPTDPGQCIDKIKNE